MAWSWSTTSQLATLVAVEVMEKGNEVATYALITRVNNLESPFAGIVFKYVDSFFKMSRNSINNGSHHRCAVGRVVSVRIFVRVKTTVAGMLPPHKMEITVTGGKAKMGQEQVFCMALQKDL
ncbi:hypothetical protein H257_19352 [Aphanomyces astaci]|uniref:Uncharacterized protein n=1 Tax=Aphanomyces astaci TaxID=112090 RepID=W4F8B3_APHAT|nr:hypothetical protein H257_19352 [Aphanomyces astaci]ETV63715.1 hypothetical protein H257_19352 [Aphanomyces astaci]RQM21886.1 hypothetical protein B5M09_013405 [Aphanomyces astaci]|eukprot:XP_009846800.1 hypothetical protein H257_19352 [Aphanomyces astaci]